MVLTVLLGCCLVQMALTGAAFSQCTACSPAVVGALRGGGWPWLLSALRVRVIQSRAHLISYVVWPGTRSLADVSSLLGLLWTSKEIPATSCSYY